MDSLHEWGKLAASSFNELISTFAVLMPRLIGAALLLILGWVVARILRGVTQRLIGVLDRLLQRLRLGLTPEYERLRQSTAVILSSFVYWAVLIVFIGGAASVLRLQLVTRLMDAIVSYAPRLFVGVAIILGGIILANGIHAAIRRTGRLAALAHNEILGRIAQVSVILVAVVLGSSQLGIDVSFVIGLLTVAFAVTLAGFFLSIALATPVHIHNYISARQLQQFLQEGDWISTEGHAGRVVGIRRGTVILKTDTGEVILPAKLLVESVIERRPGESPDA